MQAVSNLQKLTPWFGVQRAVPCAFRFTRMVLTAKQQAQQTVLIGPNRLRGQGPKQVSLPPVLLHQLRGSARTSVCNRVAGAMLWLTRLTLCLVKEPCRHQMSFWIVILRTGQPSRAQDDTKLAWAQCASMGLSRQANISLLGCIAEPDPTASPARFFALACCHIYDVGQYVARPFFARVALFSRAGVRDVKRSRATS